jgi:hypothetical protein
MICISAKEYIDPAGSIVASGELVGKAIVACLERGDEVVVNFREMKGLSSSYFNPIIQTLNKSHGLQTIGTQLKFDFNSPVQQIVFDRSLQAARINAA